MSRARRSQWEDGLTKPIRPYASRSITTMTDVYRSGRKSRDGSRELTERAKRNVDPASIGVFAVRSHAMTIYITRRTN